MRSTITFMKVAAVVLATTFGLSACSWTRLTKEEHLTQVGQFNIMGIDKGEAIKRISDAGFTCNEESPKRYLAPDAILIISSYVKDSGMEKTVVGKIRCDKRSLELMCPQRRYIDFEYAKADNKVVYMRPWIMEQSCF